MQIFFIKKNQHRITMRMTHNVENVFLTDSRSTLEPEYISGFVGADGSFFISKPSEKTK